MPRWWTTLLLLCALIVPDARAQRLADRAFPSVGGRSPGNSELNNAPSNLAPSNLAPSHGAPNDGAQSDGASSRIALAGKSSLVQGRATHPAWLAAGGLLGAALVGAGGAWTGVQITEDDCEDCFLVGGAYGLAAGVSTGIPLGVHFANHGRGDLLASLGASLALGGLGLGVAHLTNEEGVMLAVPLLQIASSILIERRGRP